MSKHTEEFSEELVNTLNKAIQNKIYGSVEIYFEAGSITQITQRIIKKVETKRVSIATKPVEKTSELPATTRTF